jgi:hypothetical protein
MVLAWNNRDVYGDIVHAIYAIVFIGCPHRPASYESLVDNIIPLISLGHERPRFGLTRTARMSALTVQETNDLFLETGILLQAQIASVYSSASDYKSQVSTLVIRNRTIFCHGETTRLIFTIGIRQYNRNARLELREENFVPQPSCNVGLWRRWEKNISGTQAYSGVEPKW